MIEELIRAIFKAGIPVAVTSYLLVWWALKNDYLGSVSDMGGVEREFKRLSKKKSAEKKKVSGAKESADSELTANSALPDSKRLNPVHNKWMTFGGGFYGVVALLTYAVVELGEIRDFVARYDGLLNLMSQFSFNMLLELFIDAMMNFVVAIGWPAYWLSDIAGEYIWIWFAVAYGAYWAGSKYALHRFNENTTR